MCVWLEMSVRRTPGSTGRSDLEDDDPARGDYANPRVDPKDSAPAGRGTLPRTGDPSEGGRESKESRRLHTSTNPAKKWEEGTTNGHGVVPLSLHHRPGGPSPCAHIPDPSETVPSGTPPPERETGETGPLPTSHLVVPTQKVQRPTESGVSLETSTPTSDDCPRRTPRDEGYRSSSGTHNPLGPCSSERTPVKVPVRESGVPPYRPVQLPRRVATGDIRGVPDSSWGALRNNEGLGL